MNINFDRPVIYEYRYDKTGSHKVIPQEDFSMIINKYMRLENGSMSDLSDLFGNLVERCVDGTHYYVYERSMCDIQRFIDKRISSFTSAHYERKDKEVLIYLA